MFIMYNRGPKIDPWGIPYLICWVAERDSTKPTYCDISESKW